MDRGWRLATNRVGSSLSDELSRRTLAVILGAAFFVWGADASARVMPTPTVMITPPWWGKPDLVDLPDLDSLVLDPIETPPITEIALPCGVFLGEEPRLTLFDGPAWSEPPAPTIVPAWHTDKSGELVHYDQIPRRWDRPLDYDAYAYPVATFRWSSVTSGYDLDLPDELQRRNTLRTVGHGGVDLAQPLGTKIAMITLEHQLGDPKVVHVGTLFGNTVVTLHAVREGGERAHYLLIFGHLDRAAEGLQPGRLLRAGDLVGFVGESESPGLVHLHLEARRIRDGVDPTTLTGYRVLDRDVTVVTDPRNLLPRKPLGRPTSCNERRRAERRAALFDDLHLTLDP